MRGRGRARGPDVGPRSLAARAGRAAAAPVGRTLPAGAGLWCVQAVSAPRDAPRCCRPLAPAGAAAGIVERRAGVGTVATAGTGGCHLALHSVSYAGVWPGQAQLTVEAFIDRAAELGYDGVMLMAKRPHASPLDLGADARARLRERLDQRGLRLSCLACYNNWTSDWEHAAVPQAEMQVLYLAEAARLARDLGGNLIRVFTAYEVAEVPYRAQWERCVRCLRELARRAAEFGVTVAVQNHHDLANHHLTLRDLLEEVGEPNCRAAFDPWAPALQGEDLAEVARTMAPWTVHTTVADYQRRPRFRHDLHHEGFVPSREELLAVPPGEGLVDAQAFLQALIGAGYTGAVGYEMCSPLKGGGALENLDRTARAFLRLARPLVPAPALRTA